MLLIGIAAGAAFVIITSAALVLWYALRRVRRQPEFEAYEPSRAARRVRATQAWERGVDPDVTSVLPLDDIDND